MNFAPAVMDVAAPVAAFFNFHAKNSDGQQTRAAAESPTAVIRDIIHFVNKVDVIGKCECHCECHFEYLHIAVLGVLLFDNFIIAYLYQYAY